MELTQAPNLRYVRIKRQALAIAKLLKGGVCFSWKKFSVYGFAVSIIFCMRGMGTNAATLHYLVG